MTTNKDFLNQDFLLGSNYDSISLWIDNYCHAHPLDNLAQASTPLVKELIQRKGL